MVIWKRRSEQNPLLHEECVNVPRFLLVGFLFHGILFLSIVSWSCLIVFGGANYAFMHFRDLRLGSGIAPALPMIFLLAAFYLGIWVHLRRVSYWEYGTVKMPSLQLDDVFPSDCNPRVEKITHALLHFPECPWGYVLLVCMLFGFLLFRPWTTIDMLESKWVRGFTLFWFAIAFLGLWSNWLRFMYVWQQMRQFLNTLERLPIRAAFSRISAQTTLSIWGWNVAAGKLLPTREAVEALNGLRRLTGDGFVPNELRKRLLCAIRGFMNPGDSSAAGTSHVKPENEMSSVEEPAKSSEAVRDVSYEAMLRVVGGEPLSPARSASSTPISSQESATLYVVAEPPDQASPSSDHRRKPSQIGCQRKELFREARAAMSAVIEELFPHLRNYWKRGDIWPGNTPIPQDRARRKDDSRDRRFELAEELVALRYYSYIRYVGTELRRPLTFVIVALLLLFVALHSYSFRAGRAIDLSFISLFVVLSLGIVLTFGQQERDALLSRLQRSTAGELGANFYLDMLKYAAVPALALIASQVPSISNFLLRWIQPSLDAYH